MKHIILVLLLLNSISLQFLEAQSPEAEKVKYTHEFRFNDGIFIDFEQVKNNDPIRKYKILTNAGYHDHNFFETVLESDVIYYFDENAQRQELSIEKIWGYSHNGLLYINLNNDFIRVTIVGGICHFVGTVVTTESRYSDPYYNPYYNSYGSYYGYYNSYYSPMRSTSYKRTEMKQFILDFETGKVMDYNVKNLEIALMRDPELYDEYIVLSSKKKKQLKFLYIRKFNERNPVFFNK